MKPLTYKQRKMLGFLCWYIGENGWAPTLQEICREFGFLSTNAASSYLVALERKGYIKTGVGKARAIAIVRLPAVDGDE